MDEGCLGSGETEMDHRLEGSVKEMDEHTRLMFNSTPLCCNLWSSDFANMRCNDEAVRLFELSSQREYLERFDELSPEYQPDGNLSSELAREYISKAFREGFWRFEWMHQKLDGTPVPSEVTLVRIRYGDDFIVAGYTRDLREEKAMLAELKNKEALRIARDEALMNSKAKSNFLANMSHEIRTPMNAISGFADIILRDSQDDKITKYAGSIKDACKNLINIVNDILDISKIEYGKLEIHNATYEFASLLKDTIAISRMRLGNKPIRFTTKIDSHLPARMVGDEIRIKQILLNILSNAIKYTDKGYIMFRVFGEIEQNRALLHFSVEDSGIGIKNEDLEHLFEEFQRVNTTKIRSIEGTGLGLAISKQLCELMGGCITVESTYGEGSIFTATIPQEYTAYESMENLDCGCVSCSGGAGFFGSISQVQGDDKAETENVRFTAPSVRILVVDDNLVNLQVAKGLLEPYQAIVDIAENGVKAINMIQQSKYDLVFMDHMMPEMDGVDATRAIRELEGEYYQTLPIIALTANALMGNKDMFIREGMNDFLAKPIEINDLPRVLLKWLPPSKVEMEFVPLTAARETEIEAFDIAGIDTVKGIASVGGSKETYMRILSIYYTEGRKKYSLLQQYVTEQNIQAFRTEVHALKSASETVGALSISSMAKKLEEAARNNDNSFINSSVDDFLANFWALLEVIRPICSDSWMQGASYNVKDEGNTVHLKGLLGIMEEAIELANISLMEQHLDQLQAFAWPNEVDKELFSMREYLNLFDYDGMMECIIRLNAML